MQDDNRYLTITPLGGLGEIGLNCQLWKTKQGVVMIDCGLMFPDDEHLGIDVVIPNFANVDEIKSELLGVVLTHGHEDHIGALPWLAKRLRNLTIFASPFTLALVEHKLLEHDALDKVKLCPVYADTVLKLGDLIFHFFPVCHSIPEGYALGVESPVGRIIHSGDFKIDPHPLAGPGTDLQMFRNFAGDSGVRLLLSDSTNVMREGHSLCEREVKEAIGHVFDQAKGRIVITLFSSHIQRIQEVFDLAAERGRTVVISGKSLVNNIGFAQELGIGHLSDFFYNAYNGIPDVPDNQLVFLVTGAQGEPLSALSRMVFGGHKQLSVKRGDTVIMSSRVIPGNARAINRLINEMYRLGADVFYESVYAIHASGHAYKDELRALIEATKPEFFIPIHGEFQHLVKHRRLAESCGVCSEKIIILEDGRHFTIFADSCQLDLGNPPGRMLVDGKGVGDVGAVVLKERRNLGDEGMVIVVLVLDAEYGELLYGPDIISQGFVFEQYYSHILEDAKCLVLDEFENCKSGQIIRMKESIRAVLRSFFRRLLDRDPVIVPIIAEV